MIASAGAAISAPDLQRAHDAAVDIIGLTEERGRELVAPIFKLVRTVTDPELRTVLITALVRCCTYNAELHEEAKVIRDAMEWLTSDALTIKAIARALREPLRLLANPPADGVAYLDAVRTVDQVIRRSTLAQLRGASLRNELRPTAHNQLLRMLEERAR